MNKKNPNCYKTFAILRIAPIDKIVFLFSEREPTPFRFVQAGENDSDEFSENEYFIEISTEGVLESTTLEDHILYILETLLEDEYKQVRKKLHDNTLQTELVCYWISATGLGGGPQLSSKLLLAISKIAKSVSFKLSAVGSPASDEALSKMFFSGNSF